MFPLDDHLVTFDRRGVTGDRCLAGDPYRPSVRSVAAYPTERECLADAAALLPDAVRNLDSTEVWAGAACVRGYRVLKQQQ